jgi:hypothetical protein
MVHDPEEGPAVEQDVAQRAAAEGSEAGDQADPDRVQPFAGGLEQAGQRKREGGTGLDGGRDQGQEGLVRHAGILARAPGVCIRATAAGAPDRAITRA